jgi:hypothetical protein
MGAVAFAITQSGCLNPILFLEEGSSLFGIQERFGLAGSMFTNKLKTLFDPAEKTIDVPALAPGFKLDISRLTIIVSGNMSLEELGAEPAIIDRFESIVFTGMSLATRSRAAELFLSPLATMELDQGDNIRARRVALDWVPTIVRRSIQVGRPGAREIQQAVLAVWQELVMGLADNRVSLDAVITQIIEDRLPGQPMVNPTLPPSPASTVNIALP